ncbi:MAG TPA: YdeI/OmpD-associated family protein [bacterium]|nr:YdeI/OmpD-associated family protein [bacterium]
MILGQTLYVTNRRDWRSWLANHHKTKKEIWLIFFKKHTKRPSIPYNDAVEEALAYGWIDSIVKTVDKDSYAQRFTPRKPGSNWSDLNKERVRRLIKSRKMTRAGLAAMNDALKAKSNASRSRVVIPSDIAKRLREDKLTWQNFQRFPSSYKRIRVGWIDAARKRPAEFEKRLRYFLRMTAQNKRFGMVQ